jgi:alpha-galactosidase
MGLSKMVPKRINFNSSKGSQTGCRFMMQSCSGLWPSIPLPNKMKIRSKPLSTLSALVLAGAALSAPAQDIPARLPAPDGKPGASAKPVKVYILAGQSNMVGMGTLSGARNSYAGIYLGSDPETPAGPLDIWQVGRFKTAPLAVFDAGGAPARDPIARGSFEVPERGVYQIQCGSGESSFVSMEVGGKPAYSRAAGSAPVRHEITLEPGKRHPFAITGFTGEAPRFWLSKQDLLGNGDLEAVVKRDGMFPWLLDAAGDWTARQDVWLQEARLTPGGKGSPLIPTWNAKTFGPEIGFGHVLGTFHDEAVLLIKTAQGNRSLAYDFRPPSSGRNDPGSEFESVEYKLTIQGVRETLAKIDQIVPGYKGQGYELAGFVWWQGHKDSFSEKDIAEYEKNLVNLINDIRKDLNAPKMPVVVAGVGFGGYNMQEKFRPIMDAQMAVGDPAKHPEFAGNVASVDTRDFWREVDESPKGEDYHYNRNAETYLRVGDALGRAMVGLLGGRAEPLPQAPRPKTTPPTAEPTAEQKAAALAKLAPIIVDGIVPAFVSNPQNQTAIAAAAGGERPQRPNQFLRDSIDALVNIYNAAGIHDYDWKVFGKDLRDTEWDYFSFDPPETLPKEKPNRYRKVTLPAGMENWFAPDFDAAKAGWKKGLPPFGQLDGKPEPLGACDRSGGCGCGEKPRTLWDKEVIVIRGTFDIPPFKDGHRYRIVIGGSNHVMSGEGYAIHANGKLLAESNSGVPNRAGGQPRGGHVHADLRSGFKGGKVTLAATSFLQSSKKGAAIPPRGHLTVWIEEQKLPPLGQ